MKHTAFGLVILLGSLSNHDVNENVTNLHIWRKKNSRFARFARAFFIFLHFADVLVLSTTWKDLLCSCVDDVSIWSQMFNFVFLSLQRWFQFNSSIVWRNFASLMTLNNCEMIAETRSYIFKWRSCCLLRRICLSSPLFRGVWNLWWNMKHEVLIWLFKQYHIPLRSE